MKQVFIKIIPHNEQRYETVGDWWFDDAGDLQIRVSDMGNQDYEQCVAFHEYFEALVATKNGIQEKDISDFDILFEKEREQGLHAPEAEPGLDKNAPYRKEHQLATGVELILGTSIGIVWNEYDEKVISMQKTI